MKQPETLYGEGDRLKVLRQLLSFFDHPDAHYDIVHLAGTNGKGSTALMIASLLTAHGERVGLFTSPHLYTPRESIQVDGIMIPNKEYDAFAERIEIVNEHEQLGALSQFEITFLIAVIYFAECGVTTAVFESGLGGALDATNALSDATYTIFTKIGLDHLHILGETIEEIAIDKAGIMRPNCPVIIAPKQRDSVRAILQTEAEKNNNPVIDATDLTVTLDYPTATVDGLTANSIHFAFGLVGDYQAENLATALTWYKLYTQQNQHPIDPAILSESLGELSLMGRFEILKRDPLLVMDAAHNADAMTAFVETVSEITPGKKVTVVCGFLKDKEVAKMVHLLKALDADFILTEPEHPDRALSVEKLAKVFEDAGVIVTGQYKDCAIALKKARCINQPTYIVGSFYLIKPLRQEVINDTF